MGTRVRCKECDNVIESKHRHDFMRCRCGNVFVDGGSDYLRLGFDPEHGPDSFEILDDPEMGVVRLEGEARQLSPQRGDDA